MDAPLPRRNEAPSPRARHCWELHNRVGVYAFHGRDRHESDHITRCRDRRPRRRGLWRDGRLADGQPDSRAIRFPISRTDADSDYNRDADAHELHTAESGNRYS